MSRRLNQEAGKTVKYGGLSEIEAWKTVTLNPAKLLHLDDRVGSIEEGKDADVVLWSDHPLSVYAKAEKTLIEGKVYLKPGYTCLPSALITVPTEGASRFAPMAVIVPSLKMMVQFSMTSPFPMWAVAPTIAICSD